MSRRRKHQRLETGPRQWQTVRPPRLRRPRDKRQQLIDLFIAKQQRRT